MSSARVVESRERHLGGQLEYLKDGVDAACKDRIARYNRDPNGGISLVIVGGIAAYGLIIVSHTCRVCGGLVGG